MPAFQLTPHEQCLSPTNCCAIVRPQLGHTLPAFCVAIKAPHLQTHYQATKANDHLNSLQMINPPHAKPSVAMNVESMNVGGVTPYSHPFVIGRTSPSLSFLRSALLSSLAKRLLLCHFCAALFCHPWPQAEDPANRTQYDFATVANRRRRRL
jgi:hypothetical protein